MTRTTKANDIPHNNPEAASLMTEAQYPKFFAKSGFIDTAPSKTKKDGGGKGNWGHPGDELEDLDEFNMTRPRRYSNTSPTHTFQLKSKFEAHDEDPLFDEDRHGPPTTAAPTEEHVVTAAVANGNGTVDAETSSAAAPSSSEALKA